jgi:alanine dehydrogenase
MVLFLTDDDVHRVLDLRALVPIVESALVKQAAGEAERPHRPHYPLGQGLESDDPLGTGIAMPAYVHGDDVFATKLVSLHEGNEDRGLPTLNAQIVLSNARTGVPLSFMDGTRITNARTGCIGALAVREFASEPVRLGVIGAGAQARWQTRAIAAVTIARVAAEIYTAVEPVRGQLLDLLTDEQPHVRANACIALGYGRVDAAAPRLADLASEDPAPNVRDRATWALKGLP